GSPARVRAASRVPNRPTAASPRNRTAGRPVAWRPWSARGSSDGAEDLIDLLLQHLRRERFDDVVVDPGLDRGDDVFANRAGRHHEDRNRLAALAHAKRPGEIDTGHVRHVPIGDHETDRWVE